MNVLKYGMAICAMMICGAAEAQLSVGNYKFKNGAEYSGELKRRKPNGLGRTVYPNGDM